ncbi:MAG: hypothetical protein KF681_15905 [Bdellovibrionaceae bacterium]|nr:hypothetical protein [Pseudobdellovibrionaceae bacterium]
MDSNFKMRKYQIRPHVLDGIQTTFSWIDDATVEMLLRLETGTPISLEEAAEKFYAASIRDDLSLDHAVLDLGIVGFALASGFRIDIFPDLVPVSLAARSGNLDTGRGTDTI